jgi:hypothetical protein
MNELTELKAKDETTGRMYRILGFGAIGDDRIGWHVSDLVLYDEDNRKQFRVTNPQEIKRLTLMK